MIYEKGTSKEEQLIYYFVKLFFPDAQNRFLYKDEKSGFTAEADIFIPGEKVVIEYDGEYWHRNRKKRDIRKNLIFNNGGCYVIRVREEGLPELPPYYGASIIRKMKIPVDPTYKLRALPNYIAFLNPTLDALKEHIKDPIVKSKLESFVLTPEIMANYLPDMASATFTVPVINNVASSSLMQFWDSDRNGRLNPMNVPEGVESLKVWWKCPSGLSSFFSVTWLHAYMRGQDYFNNRYAPFKDFDFYICPLYRFEPYDEKKDGCKKCDYFNTRAERSIKLYIDRKIKDNYFFSSYIQEYVANNESILQYLLEKRFLASKKVINRFEDIILGYFYSREGRREDFLSGCVASVSTDYLLKLILLFSNNYPYSSARLKIANRENYSQETLNEMDRLIRKNRIVLVSGSDIGNRSQASLIQLPKRRSRKTKTKWQSRRSYSMRFFS